MAKLLKKYDHVISLGCNCFVKKYTKIYVKDCETYLFDYTGSSIAGILEILKNDFVGLEKIQKIKIHNNNNNKPVNTNLQYYLRFLHEKIDNEREINKFLISLNNKITRFKNLLKSNKKVVFIRYEENYENRILYDEIKDYYVYPETHYLIQLSEWLTTNTNVNFKIIYLNSTIQSYDEKNKIYNILINTKNVDWYNCYNKINDVINENENFFKINDF